MSRAATSNYPFSKVFTAGSNTAITAGRFVGYKSGALSQDLDAVADQRSIIGVVTQGVTSANPDREFEAMVTPSAKVVMEAGAPIAIGDRITSDGDGKAVPAVGPVLTLAIANEAVPAAGRLVQVTVL